MIVEKKKRRISWNGFCVYSAQQSLYFFPLPHSQGSSGFGFALAFLDPPQQDILSHLGVRLIFTTILTYRATKQRANTQVSCLSDNFHNDLASSATLSFIWLKIFSAYPWGRKYGSSMFQTTILPAQRWHLLETASRCLDSMATIRS